VFSVCLSRQTERYLPSSSQWLLPSVSHDAQLHASAKKQTRKRLEFPNVAKLHITAFLVMTPCSPVVPPKYVPSKLLYKPLPSSEYSVEVASVSDSFVNLLNAAVTQNTGNRLIIQYIFCQSRRLRTPIIVFYKFHS